MNTLLDEHRSTCSRLTSTKFAGALPTKSFFLNDEKIQVKAAKVIKLQTQQADMSSLMFILICSNSVLYRIDLRHK